MVKDDPGKSHSNPPSKHTSLFCLPSFLLIISFNIQRYRMFELKKALRVLYSTLRILNIVKCYFLYLLTWASRAYINWMWERVRWVGKNDCIIFCSTEKFMAIFLTSHRVNERMFFSFLTFILFFLFFGFFV